MPQKMQSIVNLEALLNDGAAFVIFLVVQVGYRISNYRTSYWRTHEGDDPWLAILILACASNRCMLC